jgi:hypothetical protein
MATIFALAFRHLPFAPSLSRNSRNIQNHSFYSMNFFIVYHASVYWLSNQ